MAILTKLTFYIGFAAHTLAQQVFINEVLSYSSLSSCPRAALSAIVQDVKSGCGDRDNTTSFSCFCNASSSHFASVISTAVIQACGLSSKEATSATQVFSSYCQLGNPATTITETSSSEGHSGSNSGPTSTYTPVQILTTTVAVIIASNAMSSPVTVDVVTTSTGPGFVTQTSTVPAASSSGLSSTCRNVIIGIASIVLLCSVAGGFVLGYRRQRLRRQALTSPIEPPLPLTQLYRKGETVETYGQAVYEFESPERKRARQSRLAELSA